MEFFDILQARHSVRAYVDTPVETEKLDRILEALNLAPSAGNLQAFGMVDNPIGSESYSTISALFPQQ